MHTNPNRIWPWATFSPQMSGRAFLTWPLHSEKQLWDHGLEIAGMAVGGEDGVGAAGVYKAGEHGLNVLNNSLDSTQQRRKPSSANMMSQHAALSGFFSDEPFFSQGKLLWPLRRESVPSLKQGFFSQRAKLVDSLLKELHDGPHPFSLPLPALMSCALDRYVQCAFD